MPEKNSLILQEWELRNVSNKMTELISDKPSISAVEVENLYNRLDDLAKDDDLSEDVKLFDLSKCYVKFLTCISIFLANVNYELDDFVQLDKWIQVIYVSSKIDFAQNWENTYLMYFKDKPTGTELAKIFTEDIAMPISDGVCIDYLQLGIQHSISLMNFINSVAERNMLNRLLITFKFSRLERLYNAICMCGDYVLQSTILKFIIYMCSYNEKYEFAINCFKGNSYFESFFIRTSVYDFEDPARNFLTLVNNDFKRVFSVRAKYLQIDQDFQFYALYDDEDYYSVWLDINTVSQTISISCNINLFPEYLVSKGNGKVGNEFIIFNLNQISKLTYNFDRYYNTNYSNCCIYFRTATDDQSFVTQKFRFEFIDFKDMNKIEQQILPYLSDAL